MMYKEKISVLIRFHDLNHLEQLSICLLTLAGQTFRDVEPVLLTQRFSSDEIAEVQALLEQFSWSGHVNPRVLNLDLSEPEDLRSHLLNLGIRETSDSRFFAVLDYDDFCGQHHYERLIDSLRESQAAISYSGMILVEQATSRTYNYTVNKKFFVKEHVRLQSLFENPQFQMGCFVVDRSKVDNNDLHFDESIVYEEDYNFHLRISLQYPSSFSVVAERVPALMRTVRKDGTNSIVSDYDEPELAAKKLALRREGRRANGRLKNSLFRKEFDPFVLFWTEPFPIRGGTAYSWVVYSFGIGMSNLPKQNQYGHLRVTYSQRYKPLVTSFSRTNWAFEQNSSLVSRIESFVDGDDLAEWDGTGVALWTDLMRGRGAIYELERELLDRAYDTFQFRTVLTWGVNGAVARYCSDNDLNHVSLELGPTRIPFLETGHCDPFGVNAACVMSKLPEGFVLPELETERWLDQFVARCGVDVPPMPDLYRNVRADARKIALLPLQLADDANFLLHADRYTSFADFLSDVVPPLIESGWTCIIRPHPGAERAAYVRADHQKCREWQLSQDQEKVIWFDERIGPSQQIGLLKHADAVVSVNSSMAFEAMLMGTPVVLMGRSSFDLPGHTAKLEDLVEHRDLTDLLLLQRRLVAFNLFHHLVPVGELFSPSQLMRRLDEAEQIREAYTARGSQGLAEYLTRNVRTRLTDYFTMGLSPTRVSPVDMMAKATLFAKSPPRL
ncbi:hypothetical protein [Ciceribacter thiooxidans]|uniref:Capsular polysaccharide export protein n=1 Tax=Ciceribacter thiooxidans TaxID=1969821 RepID=A0ABV7I2J0_9HYPH|nr:hypothetical protein [Ciceribacter thiooxidans]